MTQLFAMYSNYRREGGNYTTISPNSFTSLYLESLSFRFFLLWIFARFTSICFNKTACLDKRKAKNTKLLQRQKKIIIITGGKQCIKRKNNFTAFLSYLNFCRLRLNILVLFGFLWLRPMTNFKISTKS